MNGSVAVADCHGARLCLILRGMNCPWIDPHHPTPGAPWKAPPEENVAGLGVCVAGRGKRGAVLICAGGGYESVNLAEAMPIVRLINHHGLHAFVLRYRHAPSFRYPVPYKDALRSMRVIRYGARAGWWPVDVDKVAVLGIESGGHLAALVATGSEAPKPKPVGFFTVDDEIESEEARPDAQVLAYSLIQLSKEGPDGPAGKLVGGDVDVQAIRSLDADRRVNERTPPAFVFHRVTDENSVPAFHSLAYGMALSRFKVPLVLHCLQSTDEGLGLASDLVDMQGWPELAVRWLAGMGY